MPYISLISNDGERDNRFQSEKFRWFFHSIFFLSDAHFVLFILMCFRFTRLFSYLHEILFIWLPTNGSNNLFFSTSNTYTLTHIGERWICIGVRQPLYKVLASHWSYFDKIWRASNAFFSSTFIRRLAFIRMHRHTHTHSGTQMENARAVTAGMKGREKERNGCHGSIDIRTNCRNDFDSVDLLVNQKLFCFILLENVSSDVWFRLSFWPIGHSRYRCFNCQSC